VEVVGVGEGSWRFELRGEGLEGGVGELELDIMEGYARSSDANVVEHSNARAKRGYFLNQEVSWNAEKWKCFRSGKNSSKLGISRCE
jgi:hypothetical protein